MSAYRELSKSAHSEETAGDWVDFPATTGPDPWAALLRQANHTPSDASRGVHWDARGVGGVVATTVAMALRGLLVTTAAVATAAYLLLTNSHI
jgi:hypothetical protein